MKKIIATSLIALFTVGMIAAQTPAGNKAPKKAHHKHAHHGAKKEAATAK